MPGVKVTVAKVKRYCWLTDSEIETVLQALPRMRNQKAGTQATTFLSQLGLHGQRRSKLKSSYVIRDYRG